jgi:hypothetical protein
MTHMKVIIDGKTIMDDPLGDWQNKPPAMFADAIKPQAKPAPWMKNILVTMADAALIGQATRIQVDTSSRGRWSMHVERLDDSD